MPSKKKNHRKLWNSDDKQEDWGKTMSGEDTGIWTQDFFFWFFFFKEKRCFFLVLVPRDIECNTLLKFVFEPEYYNHTAVLYLRSVDTVPGNKWEHKCLGIQGLRDIKYSFLELGNLFLPSIPFLQQPWAGHSFALMHIQMWKWDPGPGIRKW